MRPFLNFTGATVGLEVFDMELLQASLYCFAGMFIVNLSVNMVVMAADTMKLRLVSRKGF